MNDLNSNSSMDIIWGMVVKIPFYVSQCTYLLGETVWGREERARRGGRKASSVLGNYVRHVWLLDYIYIPTLVIGRRVSPEGRCANTCL